MPDEAMDVFTQHSLCVCWKQFAHWVSNEIP